MTIKWVLDSRESESIRMDVGRTATQQLAIDEAMLLMADEAEIESEERGEELSLGGGECVRVWQFDSPVVVLGRSSKVNDEVQQDFCRANQIPIERRSSGGASVVGGPGCLMYSVVLSLSLRPGLRKIDQAHQFVMSRVLQAVHSQLPETEWQGICDLTWQDRKFSGNSLRIAKRHLLYHGTLLHDFDLKLLANCLDFAPRQPEYRQGREHHRFVTNAPLDPHKLTEELGKTFAAEAIIEEVAYRLLLDRAETLRHHRYESDAWRYRH